VKSNLLPRPQPEPDEHKQGERRKPQCEPPPQARRASDRLLCRFGRFGAQPLLLGETLGGFGQFLLPPQLCLTDFLFFPLASFSEGGSYRDLGSLVVTEIIVTPG
jgi:hypothetical protein